MKLPRSIAAKLFLGMFASSAILLLALSWFSARRTTELWRRSSEEHAAQTAAVIERALRYAMLLNRKDELHASLANIAKEPTVESLRLYDKNGRILFSTEPREVGTRVRTDAAACAPCHDGRPLAEVALLARSGYSRLLESADGGETLAYIQPIANELQCSTARCHAHSPSRSVLGVMDLRLSGAAVRDTKRAAERNVLWAGLALILVSAFASALFVQRFVRRPVTRLTAGAQRVGAGDLTTRIEIAEPGELQELATTFNTMTEELARARARAESWEAELGRAVDEKTRDLGRAERQVAELEKMASLGKLSATVAHELNNPLGGILVYAKLVQRELAGDALTPETRTELLRYLDVMAKEASRCGEIVRSLLTFGRESKLRLAEARLSSVVERALLTLRHLFEKHGVSCRVGSLAADDLLVCDENQIQQALVALLVNAAEATPRGGDVEIRTGDDGATVWLEVADSGAGIAPEILPRIFEPFVSTKSDASGVGLGLSVVYGIASRHGGSIDAQSEPGRGAVFRLTLPRRPAPA